MILRGEENPRNSNVQYRGQLEITKELLATSSRSDLENAIKAEARHLVRDLETEVLADWDKLHEEPLEDFMRVLIKALADSRRVRRT